METLPQIPIANSSLVYGSTEVLPLFRLNVDPDSIGLAKKQIEVDFSPRLYSRPTVERELEAEMQAYWSKRQESNARLYDQSKFRLNNLVVRNDNKKLLELKLGLSSYKDILATHYCPEVRTELENRARFERREDRFYYMSKGLAVGTLALTRDAQLVLLRKANWVGEGPGKLDRPGGHPEPELALKEQRKCEENVVDIEGLSADCVVDEIFEAPRHELRDEVNIAQSEQGEAFLLGLVSDVSAGGRCGLDFLVHIDLDADQVQQRYHEGNQSEADESTSLLFLPLSDVGNWSPKMAGVAENLTSHGLGSFRLLHLLLKEKGEQVVLKTQQS